MVHLEPSAGGTQAATRFGLRLELSPASIGTAALALAGCLGLFASLGMAVAAFTVVFKRATMLLGMVVQDSLS